MYPQFLQEPKLKEHIEVSFECHAEKHTCARHKEMKT
jgi:hypothetical protein